MKRLLLIMMIIILLTGLPVAGAALSLTAEEQGWLDAHRNQPLVLGLDPYAGMEYFEYQGRISGYVPELAKLLARELGLDIRLEADRSWGEVFGALHTGEVTLLIGANETPERLKTMAFTEPVLRYPYAVFARRDSTVQTLGDLDGKRLGFIEGDFVQQQFPLEYGQIRFSPVVFEDQYAGINGLLKGEVEGFITSGGGVKHDFLFNFPDVGFIGEIQTITSDMTLSARKEDAAFISILNKIITGPLKSEIQTLIRDAEQQYNRKIMHLTQEEIAWLDEQGEAVVGLADDYLPFDYNDKGQYKGISGAVLDKVREITGIRFTVKPGAFDTLYRQAVAGEVDILNLALTEDRLQYFFYPRPISTERDIIIGRKSSEPVFDVYELEGRRVAVIAGFWHEEYLRKNLRNPQILITQDIKESLRMVRAGEADYLIENPTVAEYYINGLGYTDLVKKGNTSKDSFVYLGVTRKNPELASILDKALVLINYEEMKYKGIQSVPLVQNERNYQLAMIILMLAVVLCIVGLMATMTARQLFRQKAETQILKEREHLMYTDTLTGLYNRTYYNAVEAELGNRAYPQAVIITDLNMLKRTNDTYGHHVGDALITAYASLLSANLPGAVLFRMGGDEFLAFLAGTDEPEAQQYMAALKQQCQDTTLTMADYAELSLSAAVGYAVRQNAEEELNAVVIRADNQMYQDKQRGKAAVPTP